MGISRITKVVTEILDAERFSQAHDLRRIDVDFLLPREPSPGVEAMVQTATALVLRSLTGQIRIHGETISAELGLRLLLEAEKMEASGRLIIGSAERGPWALAFGCRGVDAVSGDCSGWSVRVNDIFETAQIPPATPAVGFAVACMVAKLFNAAVLGRTDYLNEAWEFCLLRSSSDFEVPIPVTPINFGDVALLGAGAIGSAVGYLLVPSGFHGSVTVIDPQAFDDPNLETCLQVDSRAVKRLARKASFFTTCLQGTKICAAPQVHKIENADDPLLRRPWDSFICAVDNSETRRLLDAANTEIILNAGLGDSKHDAGFVLWSRHSAATWPLSGLYKRVAEPLTATNARIPTEFRDACSRMEYQRVSLSIPFVALAAGSFLVASLYREAAGVSADCDYLQMDLFGKQQRIARKSFDGQAGPAKRYL